MSKLIESANYWGLIIAAFAVWRIVIWKNRNHLSAQISQIVNAWLLVFASSAFRFGWFATARHTAPPGETWNPAMFEWRWLVILVTATFFAWGMSRFIALIEGWGMDRQALMVAISFLFAIALGYY